MDFRLPSRLAPLSRRTLCDSATSRGMTSERGNDGTELEKAIKNAQRFYANTIASYRFNNEYWIVILAFSTALTKSVYRVVFSRKNPRLVSIENF
jgi:hypothetical protein